MNIHDLPIQVRQANTAIIYKGKSPINGTPIIAVISGLRTKSTNDKSGAMAQIDIMLENMHPWDAIKTGADEAICGYCPLRLQADGKRKCYVNVIFAQGGKYKTLSKIPYISPEHLGLILSERSIGVRFGSYGDPATLPYELINTIRNACPSVTSTSYTHQWPEEWFDVRHFQYSMASVDHKNTVENLRSMYGRNVRYYRLTNNPNDLAKDEILCPSDTNKRGSNGKRLVTCATCGLCSGNSIKAKNIVIVEGN